MTNISKEEVIERIIATFREYGYEGASLSLLSKATGLGRSSLYHHFPKGKEDMATAALDAVMISFDALVLSPLRQTQNTPDQRLKLCAKGLSEFYASGSRSCLINIFSVGAAGKIFQPFLQDRTLGLIKIFADISKESGVPTKEAKKRGENLIIQIQGALVLSRTLNSNSPFKTLVKEIPGLLLQAA